MKNSKLVQVIVRALLDDCSRVMPGKKDCIPIVKNGKRDMCQNDYCYLILKSINKKFTLKFPDIKISLSLFTKLCLRNCIPMGCSDSHNVCECKTHQNVKLKFTTIKGALKNVMGCCNFTTTNV